MGDFRPPLGGDSSGKMGHVCSHARDQGKVELDNAGGSNAETPDCINLA